jgi:uncharacterized protein (TIGR03067 family)
MTDLDTLQGTWHITSLETDGRAAPASVLAGSTIVVSGKTFKSGMPGAEYEGTIRVDATKSPKTFDLVFTTGPQKGTTNLGIYKLAGNTWTICLAMRGTTRPKKFATAPETGLALETLQRAGTTAKTTKAAGPAPPKTRARDDAPVAAPGPTGPPTEIEGDWTMTEGVFNGVPLDPSLVAFCTRVTRGDVTSVMAGPQVMVRARFTLDRKASPRAIDYMNLTGSHKGKAQSGIYELNGETLTISVSAPGQARPKDFATTKGDGRTLTAWKLAGK